MNIYQRDFRVVPEIFTLIRNQSNPEAIRHLEKNPDEILLQGWMDDTPLHIAAGSGNLEMVKYLIKRGAHVNAKRSGVYRTPLCWAANEEIAAFLLDHGATTNDEELYSATRQNLPKVVDLLLSRGAQILANEPQYLVCNSTECIQVYLKHNIAISGSDQNNSNLLHKAAWNELTDVFDAAIQNGCPWEKDSSGRTPWNVANEGGREKMIQHLQENYPWFVEVNIEMISPDNYQYDWIFFVTRDPDEADTCWAQTRDNYLVKYQVKNEIPQPQIVGRLNCRRGWNFTFDEKGNLVVPVCDFRVAVIDRKTLLVLHVAELEKSLDADQVTWLPGRRIFLSSAPSRWEVAMLDPDFSVLHRQSLDLGPMLPFLNQAESLVGMKGYDQDVHFSLYRLEADNTMKIIKIFWDEETGNGEAFALQGNKVVIAYLKHIDFLIYDNGVLIKQREMYVPPVFAADSVFSLVFAGSNHVVLGCARRVMAYELNSGEIVFGKSLELDAPVRNLYYEETAGRLWIWTKLEVKVLLLEF